MVTAKVKKLFFDSKAVIAAVDKAKRKVMSRQGALVMRIDRNSHKVRKAASPPGQPPSAHTKKLKRGIFFSYDPNTDSVVIGPVGFSGSNAPEVLEKGGWIVITGRNGKKRRVFIAARPSAGPALKKALPLLAKEWEGAVK